MSRIRLCCSGLWASACGAPCQRGLRSLALLLLGVAVGVDRWRERFGRHEHAALPEPVSLATEPIAAAAVVWPAASPYASMAASAARPLQAASATTPPAVWDLCGIGHLPVPPAAFAAPALSDPFNNLPSHLGEDPLKLGLLALVHSLDQGPPRWRAAAIMLRGTGAAGEPFHLAMRKLASTSSDPVVAMWALQRCGGRDACASADLQRWLALDADNQLAWMAAFERYSEQRQLMAEKLTQASRFDEHENALTQAVWEALPPDFPPHFHHQLWIYITGVQAALSVGGLQAVAKSCPQGMKPGSDQALWCGKVAKTMVDTSTSFLGLYVGLRLAERTYMPVKEAASRRAEYEKLSVLPLKEFDFEQPMSCAANERVRSWIQKRATLGELQAHRALASAQAASQAPR